MRKVKPIELNKEIKFLPDGVIGYVYGHQVGLISGQNNSDFSKLKFEKIQPDSSTRRFFFQIRKNSEQDIQLVGYISDEAELRFSHKRDFHELDTIVFPYANSEFKNQIQIPLTNKLKISHRSIEDDNGMDITILEIQKRSDEPKQQHSPAKLLQTENKKNNQKPLWARAEIIALFIAIISVPWWPNFLHLLLGLLRH